MTSLARVGFGGLGKSGGVLALKKSLADFLKTAFKYSVMGASFGNSGATNINWSLCVSPWPGAIAGTAITVGGITEYNTPAATQAMADMIAAYHAFWAIPVTSDASGTVSGDLAGLTLPGGVYRSNSVMSNSGAFTLFGDSSTVFVFLVNGAYSPAISSSTVLTGPGGNRGIALARNVYFVVNGEISAGASAALTGTFLSLGNATLGAAASVNGRILVKGMVNFSANNVTTTS